MTKAPLNNILRSDLEKKWGVEVSTFIRKLESLGFSICLVGGAVRDYLASGKISDDLDFELRHAKLEGSKDFLELVKGVTKDYNGKEIGLSILLFHFEGFSLELSPPRKESYLSYSPPYGHKDFDVIFDFQCAEEVSFVRRDFTLNALGLKFGEEELTLVDPFNGFENLNQKLLVPCGKDFSKDPVRFLRTLRFSMEKNLKFDQSILKSFDLSKLTAHYFFKEGFKVGIVGFSKQFFYYVDRLDIAVAEQLESLRFFVDLEFESYEKNHFLKEMRKDSSIKEDDLFKIAQLLGVGKKVFS